MPALTADDRLDVAELLYAYAARIDRGDFAGLGQLLDRAQLTFEGQEITVQGAHQVQALYESTTRRYGDGTPKSKHVITNVIVWPGAEPGRAVSESYFTVLQAVPGEIQLQPVIAGRYRHEFTKQGVTWEISNMHIIVELLGDLHAHLLFDLGPS
jgi:hypothetical protein